MHSRGQNSSGPNNNSSSSGGPSSSRISTMMQAFANSANNGTSNFIGMFMPDVLAWCRRIRAERFRVRRVREDGARPHERACLHPLIASEKLTAESRKPKASLAILQVERLHLLELVVVERHRRPVGLAALARERHLGRRIARLHRDVGL